MPDGYVLSFSDASSTHDLVGGKGANLAALTQAGFPEPAGFTVTTAGYAEFLQGGGLREPIDALVSGLDYGDADMLERTTAEIRTLITDAAFPASMVDGITTAYGALGDGTYVAVRSSGTAEDLAEASFAGMHDTYLDITGPDAVLDAIKRCWASLWTARAPTYRHTLGFDNSNGIAVVVQTMVPSEVSGVMFTANPLTAATHEIVINASWGLGEATSGASGRTRSSSPTQRTRAGRRCSCCCRASCWRRAACSPMGRAWRASTGCPPCNSAVR